MLRGLKPETNPVRDQQSCSN